jgi:3-deoxy-manno-octulosonate cytidylyltransferase (CMP-KDO synthetase)
MTRRDHPNGTSRVAEVAGRLTADLIVNVQGDEPQIEPALIDRTIQMLIDHPDRPMATLASPFGPDEDPADPNIVKVVIDQSGRALYFSRALIPFDRDAAVNGRGGVRSTLAGRPMGPLKHVGLYVYRREFLATYVALPPTPLEQIERLEQLRALEHGYAVGVAIGESRFHGIDTPEQYDTFVKLHGAGRIGPERRHMRRD